MTVLYRSSNEGKHKAATLLLEVSWSKPSTIVSPTIAATKPEKTRYALLVMLEETKNSRSKHQYEKRSLGATSAVAVLLTLSKSNFTKSSRELRDEPTLFHSPSPGEPERRGMERKFV